MINVTCRSCGKNYKLRDELAGREGKCPCGAVLVIPTKEKATALTAIQSDGRPASQPASVSSSVQERQRAPESNRSNGLAIPAKRGSVASSVDPADQEQRPQAIADPTPAARPRSRKRVLVIAGVAVGLLVAAVTAELIFVAIPNNRKINETFKSVVAQTDQIAAMRDKAAKQQQEENAAKLAAVLAQQSGSIEGNVWLEKASGETLSIANESVYLFPVDIKTDGPKGNFHFGMEAIQIPIDTAAELPGNDMAAAAATDAKKDLEPLKPFINAATAPSITVISGSIAVCGIRASANQTSKLLGHDHASAVETTIENETFWKLMTSQSINVVETGRDGKFVIDDCPPGTYVIGCRCFKPALSAVVYWGQKLEVKPGKSLKMDLTPSNAVVITF